MTRGRTSTRAESLHPDEEQAPYDPFDLALGAFYGPKRDMQRYRKLVQLGAAAGDPLAEYAMATWFLHGNRELGIAVDIRRAVGLLRRAARSLNRAMYDLGVCMARGEGMRVNRRGAYRLFARASDQGSLAAMEAQADCLLHGVGVRQDKRAAAALARRAGRLRSAMSRIGGRSKTP